jgi:hypothetical protein
MPLSGTASDISAQDAKDLLTKLIEESTKLQAIFRGPNGIAFGLTGFLKPSSKVQLMVKPDLSPGAPFLAFTPGLAVGFKYAAGRAISDLPVPTSALFSAALTLIYPDSSQVYLLELAQG